MHLLATKIFALANSWAGHWRKATPTVALEAVNHSLVTAALLLFACTCANGHDLSGKLSVLRKSEELKAHETDTARNRRVVSAYYALFNRSASAYVELKTKELRVVLDATNEASYFSDDSRLAFRAYALLTALMSRRAARPYQISDLYRQLVQHRRFSEARRVYLMRGSAWLPELPSVTQLLRRADDGVTAYSLDGAGSTLVEHEVWMPKSGIIVVAQPGCHFSENAAAEIGRDSILSKTFRDHSVWVAPPTYFLDLASLLRWNRSFPAVRLSLVAEPRDWKMIDNWATPTFYFVQGGKVVGEEVGWPPYGGWTQFASELRRLGLATGPQAAPSSDRTNNQKFEPTAQPWAGEQESVQAEIDRALAPIKSRVELESYVRHNAIVDTPLGFLPERQRERFLESISFDTSGVASISLDALRGLSITQAYAVLALFGMQRRLTSISR